MFRKSFLCVSMWIVLIGAIVVPNKAEAQKDTVTYDGGATFEVISPKARLPEAPKSATTFGQTICEGNNYASNTFNDSWFMGGPLVGISWVPSISATITHIEIWTGETNGPIALAIWSNNAGQPGVNLGNTGYFPIDLPNSWQGAPIYPSVAVTAFTQYWVVFDPTGGEQAPIQNCEAGQPYWASYSGDITGNAIWYGASSSIPFSSPDHCWKFRMFCGCIPPPPNAIAWWPGDDNTTEILHGNDGTLMGGATYCDGKVDRGFHLVNAADYVEVPHDPNGRLDFGEGDLTVDAWINTQGTSSSALTIVDKRGGTNDNPIGYAMFIYQGKLGFQLGDGQLFLNHVGVFAHLNDGNWYHVAVTVDRNSTTGGKMYIDGQLDDTFDPTTRSGNTSNSSDLLIGQRIFQTPVAFDGCIDEVELFDRALSEPEIKSIFYAGTEGKCKCDPGCKLWTNLSGFADDYAPSPPPDPSPTPSRGLLLRWPSCVNTRGYDDFSIDKCFLHTFYVPVSGICPTNAWVIVGIKPAGGQSENDRIALVFTDKDGQAYGEPEWSAQIDGNFGLGTWDEISHPNRVILSLDLSNLLGAVDLIPSLEKIGFLDLAIHDDTDVDFAELLLCYSDFCVRAPAVDMVAWWSMDEQVGATIVQDFAVAGYHPGTPYPGGQIGNGNPAYGPMPATGKVGGALYFWDQDIDNRFVRVSAQPDIEFGTTDFSIDAWVKIMGSGMGYLMPIVEKMQYNGMTPYQGYLFCVEGLGPYDAYLLFVLAGGGTTGGWIDFPISLGVWHHVAVTVHRDPVSGDATVSLYVDGMLANRSTFNNTTSIANTEDLIIGRSLWGVHHLPIYIDELEIFDRVLADFEVFSIFDAGSLGKCKGDLSGMKFHDHNGDGFKDPGDGGLVNWTIFIDTDKDEVLDHPGEPYRITDAQGSYSFTVPIGEYTICEVNQPGWTQTLPVSCYTKQVRDHQPVFDLDFGNSGIEPCPNNIVHNWSFTPDFVPWAIAYGTPDVWAEDGCLDLTAVAMEGNKVIGEAIYQALASPFTPGWTYAIECCAKWAPVPGRPYPVQFEFRASNQQLTSPADANGVRIGVIGPVTPQQQWMSMAPIYWTVPAGPTYSILTVSATNQSSANDIDSTSYGAIDRICIYRFIRGDPNGDGVIDISDVVYLLNYLFVHGPAPVPILDAGDATCDGVVDASDVVYLLNYLFVSGPPPNCP
jgi:hypothetical protein